MWTAYEPSFSFSTRLTVPPGYLASAAALASFAAAPVSDAPLLEAGLTIVNQRVVGQVPQNCVPGQRTIIYRS
jgi:hypothetical protein